MAEKPLTPPDLERCQALIITRTPFALGGTHRKRQCDEVPTVVVIEKRPGADGRIGSMSLCPRCLEEMFKKLDKANFTVAKIKRKASVGS